MSCLLAGSLCPVSDAGFCGLALSKVATAPSIACTGDGEALPHNIMIHCKAFSNAMAPCTLLARSCTARRGSVLGSCLHFRRELPCNIRPTRYAPTGAP